jgi:hypothetical protein
MVQVKLVGGQVHIWVFPSTFAFKVYVLCETTKLPLCTFIKSKFAYVLLEVVFKRFQKYIMQIFLMPSFSSGYKDGICQIEFKVCVYYE